MKQKILHSGFLYTLIAIVIGFVFGALLLLMIGVNPGVAYGKLASGVFSKQKYIVYSIVYGAPLILTGLSVAFSFRTGVFNIGAEGHYVMGSLAAVTVGILVDLPAPLHAVVCIIAAAAAGAVWGAGGGVLKVKKGINEVLSYIMFNWIAFYFSNYIVNLKAIHTDQGAEATKNILDSASIKMPKSIIAMTGCGDVHWGIFLSLIAAVVIWYVLTQTTFGYELRAVGFSRTAAEYAGISSSRIFLISMAISGMLSGLGGAVQTLGMSGRVPQFASQEQYGFQGITVALIGGTSPIGCILSGIFYGAMKYGGNKLTVVNVPTEVVNIIMGTIIIFIAIAPVFRNLFLKAFSGKESKN